MTTPLRDRRCRALPSGSPTLQDEQSVAMLAQLDAGWRISDDGKSLRRAFGFQDFYRTRAFLNAVAWSAPSEDHHPAVEAGYNYCRLEFSTHSIGGLSENDFICAAKIDAL